MDRYELRRLDYSLTEDHKDLQAAYRQLFDSHCTIETVWAAEESGYDKSLWERLCAMGASSMAIGEQAGGDGATLVDLTLVAEEVGRALAPVPWIDHVVATRLWERLGGVDPEAVAGTRIVALDPRLELSTGRRLIGSGAVADRIIVRDGDDVVLVGFDTQPAKVDNDLFVRDYGKCILCYKCVEACGTDAQNTFAIAVAGRGFDARISTEHAVPLTSSACGTVWSTNF